MLNTSRSHLGKKMQTKNQEKDKKLNINLAVQNIQHRGFE